MQRYTFEQDKERKDLCTIAMLWGLFCCVRLPMGVSPSPEITQEIMEQVWASLLKEIEACLDDIVALLDDWESHLVLF